MKEKKKITTLGGEPGSNRATIENEELPKTEMSQHALDLIEDAGRLFLPDGAVYAGSAVVHYFTKEDLKTNPQYFYLVQLNIKGVHEAHAGLGIQGLRQQIMEGYGHKQRTRD